MFWEFNRAASGKPDDWHYLPAIAAALRAVVEQLGYSNVPEEFADLRPFVIDSDELLALASELEGVND